MVSESPAKASTLKNIFDITIDDIHPNILVVCCKVPMYLFCCDSILSIELRTLSTYVIQDHYQEGCGVHKIQTSSLVQMEVGTNTNSML